MNKDNVNINRLTCRFDDKTLEKEYLTHSWKNTWKNIKIILCVDVPLGFIIRADDIFVQGVGANLYYLSYHVFSIRLLI